MRSEASHTERQVEAKIEINRGRAALPEPR